VSVVGSDHNAQRPRFKFRISSRYAPIFWVALFYTILGISACQNVDNVSQSQVFRYNEDASVNTLDPAFAKSQSELWIVSQLFNGLVELDSALGVVPALAKHWEVSEDGTRYRFDLRTDVWFCETSGVSSNQLLSNDVVATFRRLIDPKTASPGAWIFVDKVKGPESFQAIDDSTLSIELTRPFPAFLSLLSMNFAYIMPEEWTQKEKSFLARNACGTGPFYLKRWEQEVKMVLRQNPHYFEFDGPNRLPHLQAVNIDFVKNKQTAFMQFVSGKYDFFNGLESSIKDELFSKEGELNAAYRRQFQAILTPFLNTEFIAFNLGESGPAVLRDKFFRLALSSAVDREGLVRFLRNGVGDPAHQGFVPPSLMSQSVKGQQLDVSKAKEYLQASTYKGEILTLATTSDYLDMAIYLQKAWENLGINIRVQVESGGMLRQKRNQGDLQLYRGSWIADYPDAENYLSCFYSAYQFPNGPNYSRFSNAEFDAQYETVAGLGSASGAKLNRALLLAQADQLLMDEGAVIVLYYDKSVRLVQNHVRGLGNDPANRLILKRVFKTTP
jgi:peptide/nickel transport system substrate-binding protein